MMKIFRGYSIRLKSFILCNGTLLKDILLFAMLLLWSFTFQNVLCQFHLENNTLYGQMAHFFFITQIQCITILNTNYSFIPEIDEYSLKKLTFKDSRILYFVYERWRRNCNINFSWLKMNHLIDQLCIIL